MIALAGILLPSMLLGLGLTSCASNAHSGPSPVRSRDDTETLLHHPQFNRAAAVAPDFVNDVLTMIRRLDRELGDAGR